MAYNPFNWFRKNQKVIFAALTIMCMIVFVFQFGAGDPLTRALHWMTGGRAQGATVQTLNGRRVTEGDLAHLAAQRQAANAFIYQVAATGQEKEMDQLLNKRLKGDSGKDNPLIGLRDVVQKVQENRRSRMQMQNSIAQMTRRPDVPDMQVRSMMQFLHQERIRHHREAEQALPELATVAARIDPKQDDDSAAALETVQHVGAVLGLELAVLDRELGLVQEELLMGGSRQVESLLDFVLWQQQADKLGITLVNADVSRELVRMAAGYAIFDPEKTALEREQVLDGFLKMYREGRGGQAIRPEELIEGVRQELRVAMAQGLLLGVEPGMRRWRSRAGISSGPAVGTPDEFYQFYREQTTTVRVQMLPVDVEQFLPKVPAQAPSEEALRKLFERYREQEPSPGSRTPGFKEPRRVRAEYVIGDSNSAYYRTAPMTPLTTTANPNPKPFTAPRVIIFEQMAEPFRRAKVCVTAPALGPVGAGPLAWALAVSGTIVVDPVQTEYQAYLKTTDAWVAEEGSRSIWDRPQLSSLLRPSVLASVLGTQLTAGAAGSPFVPAGSYLLNGLANEAPAAIRYNVARIAASANAEGLGGLLSAVALTLPAAPPVLPIETLRPTITASLEDKLARTLLNQNLRAFSEELEKLRGKQDAGGEVLAKKAKELNLTYHRMPRPMSEVALREAVKKPKNELELEAFHQAFNRIGTLNSFQPVHQRLQMFNAGEARLDEAVRAFYLETGTYTLTQFSFLASEKEVVVFWRSEDLPARLRNFEAAREDVLAAWRLEKARELARNKATELTKTVNAAKGTPTDAVRLLREAKLGEPFELENVAQAIPPEKEVRPGVRTEYRAYQLPQSLETVFPYPPADLPKQLLGLKRAGDAMVIVDRPARQFYVAVLEARDDRTVSDFKAVYGRTPANDGLYDLFVAQKRAEYRKAVMDHLRREANAKLARGDRYDIPENVRKQFSGQAEYDE